MNAMANFLLVNEEPRKLDAPGVQMWRGLALAAKAMNGEPEKCLAAGVYDNLAKPVNTDPLFSRLRVWLYRGSIPNGNGLL